MRSTFYGFEIAKSGLFASQQNLNITGHNIANVNTIGYSRQRLTVEAIPPPYYNGLIAYSDKSASGQGVRMVFVDQIRNPFLDAQFRQENTKAQGWNTKEYEFAMVEGLFNNEITADESGVSATFADFYAALHKFAENPTDPEIRQSVLQSALNLTTTMQQNAKRLTDQYNNINGSINSTVIKINSITKSIAALNNQIFSYEMSGAQANDLRDQRNLLLDELAGIIPITYKETSEGYFIVEYQGRELVNHATGKDLAVAETKNHEFIDGAKVYELYWADQLDPATGLPLDIPGTTDKYPPLAETQGSLGAYFQMRDGDTADNMGIPRIMNLLDGLCQKIAREFNKVHVNGWSLQNGADPSTNNNKFFADGIIGLQRDADGNITGYWKDGMDPAVDAAIAGNPYDDESLFKNITAANFDVDQAIKDNIYLIAGSDTETLAGADNEQRGNNKIALELVELITKTNASGNPDNFDSAYKDILVNIGLEMSQIRRMSDNQTTVLANIQGQRSSIMDVSLDEEITNIVKFGHSYNAASRLITAIDEQLDTIINKMGVVGR